MMDLKLRKDFLAEVESAVVSAERKHPKVCDEFCTKSKEDIASLLKIRQYLNDKAEGNGSSEWYEVIREEVLEAVEAFNVGQYKLCLKELAQVAAVAVRGMEFVYRLTEEAKASEKWRLNQKYKVGAND